jgi:DNA-binding transcriptional LysR family regulator
VVQGNVFDQAYEQQLLASIAERMDVSLPELSTAVQGLEQSIGFHALVANDVEELQQA